MKTLGVVWGPQGVECMQEDRVEAFFVLGFGFGALYQAWG